MKQQNQRLEEHLITEKPYYLPLGSEVQIDLAAHKNAFLCS